MIDLKKLINNNKIIIILAFFIIFIPRVIYLGLDAYNYDACCDRWFYRSDRFMEALLTGDFEQTYQKYHPGVTIMYLVSIGERLFNNITIYKFNTFINDLFWSKILIVLFESVMLIYSLMTLWRSGISKTQLSYLTLLLAFEPYYLGIHRFLHVTGPESVLYFAFLTQLFYIYQTNNKNILNLTKLSLILALLILTKITGVIILAFMLLIFLEKDLYQKIKSIQELKKYIMHSSTIILITSILIYIFFPAMWFSPLRIIKQIYLDGFVGTATEVSKNWGPITNIRYLYFYEVYFIRSSLSIIPAVLSLVYLYINRKKMDSATSFLIVCYTFIIYYAFVLVLPGKVNERYIAALFPFVLYACFVYTLSV